MSGAGDGWQSMGAHFYREEAPDVFVTRVEGDVSGGDMERMFEALERFAARAERGFWVSDLSRMRSMAPEVRKIGATRPVSPKLQAALVVGASFHVRVLSTLMVKAAQLFGVHGGRQAIVLYFDDEAAARRYIEERRAHVR